MCSKYLTIPRKKCRRNKAEWSGWAAGMKLNKVKLSRGEPSWAELREASRNYAKLCVTDSGSGVCSQDLLQQQAKVHPGWNCMDTCLDNIINSRFSLGTIRIELQRFSVREEGRRRGSRRSSFRSYKWLTESSPADSPSPGRGSLTTSMMSHALYKLIDRTFTRRGSKPQTRDAQTFPIIKR